MDPQYQYVLSKLFAFQDKIQALTEEVSNLRGEVETGRGVREALEAKLRYVCAMQAQTQAQATPQPQQGVHQVLPQPGWCNSFPAPARIPYPPLSWRTPMHPSTCQAQVRSFVPCPAAVPTPIPSCPELPAAATPQDPEVDIPSPGSLVEEVADDISKGVSLKVLKAVAQRLADSEDARDEFTDAALFAVAEDCDAAPVVAMLAMKLLEHSDGMELRRNLINRLQETFMKGFGPDSSESGQEVSVALTAHLYLVGGVSHNTILKAARALVGQDDLTEHQFNLAANLLFATSQKMKSSSRADQFDDCEADVIEKGREYSLRRHNASWVTVGRIELTITP